MQNIVDFIYRCPSKYRRAILIILDFSFIIISFYLTNWLLVGRIDNFNTSFKTVF